MRESSTIAHYRQRAQECRDLASRLSLVADRERLLEMASRWDELASRAERPEGGG